MDLADEPVLPPTRKLALAALALHLGLSYEAPGTRIDPPVYEDVDTDAATLAVIGTGKRAGKTAVAGHWAGLLRERGARPVIVCMGRGGPAEPRSAPAGVGGGRAARDRRPRRARGVRLPRGRGARRRADRGLPARGRRPGGRARRVERARGGGAGGLARPGRDPVRGLGRLHPAGGRRANRVRGGERGARAVRRVPAAAGRPRPGARGRPRARRARSASTCAPSRSSRCRRARRVALFTTGAERCEGVDPGACPPPTSLAARALAEDLDRAAAERCDVYLTELKAAAIDTVARRARAEGARVVFRPQPPRRSGRGAPGGVGRCLRRSSSTRATACPTRRG